MATRRSFLAGLGIGLFSAAAAWADPPGVISAPAAATDAVDTVRQYLAYRATNEWTKAYALLSLEMQKMVSLNEFVRSQPFPSGSSAEGMPPSLVAMYPFFVNTGDILSYKYQVVGIAPEDPHTVLVSAQPQSTGQTDAAKPLLLRVVTVPDPLARVARIDLNATIERNAPLEFAKARENARQTASLSNLKQLSLAMFRYAYYHNEHYPPAAKWVDAISPYLAGTSGSHAERQRATASLFHDPSAPDGQKWSYAFNSNLSKLTLAQVAAPATTVLLFESNAGVKNAADTGQSIPRPGRHSGGTDYALADGHCKYYRDTLPAADRRQFLSFSPTGN